MYAGSDASAPLVWSGCRASVLPFVLSQSVNVAAADASWFIVFQSNNGSYSGRGQGWQVCGLADPGWRWGGGDRGQVRQGLQRRRVCVACAGPAPMARSCVPMVGAVGACPAWCAWVVWTCIQWANGQTGR